MQRFGLTTDRTAPNPAYPPLQRGRSGNALIANVLQTYTVGAGFPHTYCHVGDFPLAKARRQQMLHLYLALENH